MFLSECSQAGRTGVLQLHEISAAISSYPSGSNTSGSLDCPAVVLEKWPREDFRAHFGRRINLAGTRRQEPGVIYFICPVKTLEKGNTGWINTCEKQVQFCQDTFILKLSDTETWTKRETPSFRSNRIRYYFLMDLTLLEIFSSH